MAGTTPVTVATLDVARIPSLRRMARLSQAELAARVGTTPQELSRLESALRPCDGLLARVIEVLTEALAERAAA